MTPAGALRVVVAPTRKVEGAGPLVVGASWDLAKSAMPKGAAELAAARSPRLSKAMPLGATRVWLVWTATLERVMDGVGVPPAASCVGVNSTRVLGGLALLDHRSPLSRRPGPREPGWSQRRRR